MDQTTNQIMIFLLICFFSIFIFFQIYLVIKIRKIIRKLIEILFLFDHLVKKFRPNESATANLTRTCTNCKNRVPFYLNDPQYNGYFYYRCQLTKKHVLPDNSCVHFMFDPQISDAQ
jgi:hypothetical protein